MKKVVTYRCVVEGCGNTILAIDTVDGRPVYGVVLHNSVSRLWAKAPGSTGWRPRGYLDDPAIARGGFEFGCRKHGTWHLTYAEMLDHWEQALRGGSHVHRLDESSEWRGPFTFPDTLNG